MIALIIVNYLLNKRDEKIDKKVSPCKIHKWVYKATKSGDILQCEVCGFIPQDDRSPRIID